MASNIARLRDYWIIRSGDAPGKPWKSRAVRVPAILCAKMKTIYDWHSLLNRLCRREPSRGGKREAVRDKEHYSEDTGMLRNTLRAVLIGGFGAGLMASAALAESPVKAGELTCTLTEAEGNIISTELTMACDYVDINGNNAGTYDATLDRKGLSLGNVEATEIAWLVSTLGDPKNIDLSGTYVGAEVGASVGAGAGANYLTGGFNGKISLQPWSAEGKSGFGIELGGQKMVLTKTSES